MIRIKYKPSQTLFAALVFGVLIAHKSLAQDPIADLCQAIGNKLGSVSVADCVRQNLSDNGARSVNGRAIAEREFRPLMNRQARGKVLLIGGIHGDEYSSVSISFKWMDILSTSHSGLFHWKIIPLSNPDGLLRRSSQRQNANGVDLNRNFPSQDWHELAQTYWKQRTGSNERRYPGESPMSEPETQWLVEEIQRFKPDIIVSVHAPFHLIDFDGPASPPPQIGHLYLHQLGVYPGSLGNYAGLDLEIPVVTIELPSAGIMPKPEQIELMWHDLVDWLQGELVFKKAAVPPLKLN